ncbi:MAG: FG-GAP-like repeat-containing protein [Planctomycetota bacterium]|nr:FG-GAP-like repeat-containing protein [Planctomycetota bacterium]
MLLAALLTGAAHGQIWERCALRDTLVGASTGDQFGWVGENAGDVDGDGIDDYAIGAPGSDAAGNNSGRVTVYSGADAALLFVLDGSSPGTRLGTDVGAAGDVNGDGFADVIVGGLGEVRVHLGPHGAGHLALSSPTPGDGFGSSVSTAGDVDGDGDDDLIVGAPADDSAATNAGRVYVLSGTTGAPLFVHDGEAAGDGAGGAVGFLMDRNGDGHGDYLYGAPNAGATGGGRAYVHSGLDGSLDCVLDTDATGSNLGTFFLGWCGDPTGDGVPDFFASDWANTANGPGSGRVFVFSGLDCSLAMTLTGQGGEGFGIGRGWAGDHDGDGHDDLVFGSWTANDGASNAGKVTLFSGADGSVLATWTGEVAQANLGFDAAGMGDVDGDGHPDFLLTAASQSGNTGVVHLVHGGPARLPTRYCVAGVNSTGSAAELRWKFATSVSANQLRLRVVDAVPNELAVFLASPERDLMPFGGGTLCLSGGVRRAGSLVLGNNGAGFLDLDFTAPNLGAIVAGSTWSFQAWYRDPGGAGGQNLTDALRIPFCD